MPPRSKITALPDAIRAWLDETLVEGNFSGYEALEADLKERGFSIGKSAIHRHGQALERKLASIRTSTEAAKLIVDATPDEADARSEALLSLVQHELFQSLNALEEAKAEDAPDRVALLGKAAKGIADVVRASVNQKKWVLEVQARANAAADAAAKIAQKGGLSDKAVSELRAEILGIAN